MGGRPSKPVDMLLLEGKSHRTKAELELRKEAEKALYTGECFLETQQVKENQIAHKEFLRLKRLYGKITYIDALDQQIINRYCLEIANQVRLSVLLDKLENKLDDDKLETNDLVNLSKSISSILSNVAKSKELLLKYEDRLFLNPATRVKSIPKTPEKKAKPSGIAAFRSQRTDG